MEIDIRDSFFNGIYDIISNDKNAIILTSDHGAFGLKRIQSDYPKQYINIGIAEQNMVNVSAGLAMSGKSVYIYGIISFVIFRAAEQININIASMNLDVNIIGVGSGFSYSRDGPTHHGIQDIAIMFAMPNMSIFNISDAVSAYNLALLSHESKGPKYFRIGKERVPDIYSENDRFTNGLNIIRKGKDIVIISSGLMIHKAIKVSKELSQKGYDSGVIDIYRLKPLNQSNLVENIINVKKIIVLEDNICYGGLGEKICSILCQHDLHIPIKIVSIGDRHCFYCNNAESVYEHYELSVNKIIFIILQWLKEN